MAKPKLPTMKRRLKQFSVLLILFIVATTVLTFRFDTAADDGAAGPNNPRHSRAGAADDAALAYIPRSVVDTWSRREYLVVLGIPSTDVEERRTRRNLQRTTCWRFPGVATRANDFTGAMLVLYVLGRHPSHGYDYSAAMLEEVAQWNDVVALPMKEGRSTTNKTIGSYGSWGAEADVGMTARRTCGLPLRSACSLPRVTLQRVMMIYSSVCRYSLVTCAFCRAEGSTWGSTLAFLLFRRRYTQVTRLWLAGATPCRGMWRRRWCRTSRCDAWRTCRTARNVITSLHCSSFMGKMSWSGIFLRGW
ncbi:putative UDP-Gal or UDP-GlcNAc-dependent glycosyltransferase [Trypanosoma cruzi]|uniref:Putative UDP-Gal or UDP-GlcNAc-dependent glycosyltransferase n=1 Tax=Trypanosoma cruzi TaxID=5693 RepID=A0A2V2UKD0_TRYCR|nr:putative UDP-Gal or UDP-GlcNAc-dependent glycosyltransferase [Trypanosoma cruzi]